MELHLKNLTQAVSTQAVSSQGAHIGVWHVQPMLPDFFWENSGRVSKSDLGIHCVCSPICALFICILFFNLRPFFFFFKLLPMIVLRLLASHFWWQLRSEHFVPNTAWSRMGEMRAEFWCCSVPWISHFHPPEAALEDGGCLLLRSCFFQLLHRPLWHLLASVAWGKMGLLPQTSSCVGI